MGYTKKWIPTTIPIRNDLPTWKSLFTDVHDNLIEAGLVQTATAGQLDFNAVTVLPADGTYAGFREYAFNDALQETAPIIIKLEFGCGIEGLYAAPASLRSRTPRIRVTITFASKTITYSLPQEYALSASAATNVTGPGVSYACVDYERGFVGFVYGTGSRNNPPASTSGSYFGSTLILLISRTFLSEEHGISVYYPYLSKDVSFGQNMNGTATTPDNVARMSYVSESHLVTSTTLLPWVGSGGAYDGNILIQPAYVATPSGPHVNPNIVLYKSDIGSPSIPDGTEFEIEVTAGTPTKFIALGIGTGISPNSNFGFNNAIAMLFE